MSQEGDTEKLLITQIQYLQKITSHQSLEERNMPF